MVVAGGLDKCGLLEAGGQGEHGLLVYVYQYVAGGWDERGDERGLLVAGGRDRGGLLIAGGWDKSDVNDW